MNKFNLSIYDKQPQIEVTIDRFEEIAVSRLTVLRWIEHQKANHTLPFINTNNKKAKKRKYLDDILFESNLLNNAEYDNLSHFICRLALAQIKEYSLWFIKHEVTLFESKYILSSESDKLQIELKLFNDNCYPLYNANDIILNDLNGRTPIPFFRFSSWSSQSQNLCRKYLPFHIVPFNECPAKLIAQRLVYIRNGFVFIPHFLYPIVLCDKYYIYLRQKMETTKHALIKMKRNNDIMHELSKIIYLTEHLHKIPFSLQQKGDIVIDHNIINHFNIKQYIHLFPICMRYSYESLLKYGHLKNNARIQLTLFLKGIGLSLEEATMFFKKHFTQKQSKFDNHYAYFIRHQFGKEGASINYTPFSCTKIIMKNDYGCPFKLFDHRTLAQFIKEYYKVDYKGIMTDRNQLKCKELFNILNKNVLKEKYEMDIEDIHCSWNHPNTYYNINRDIKYIQNKTEFKQKYHRNCVNRTCCSSIKIEYNHCSS